MFQPEIIAQKEIISQTDRAAVLDSIAGGCCIISCEEERILYVNASVLFSYTCPDQESFLRMTGGSFRGMVEAEDYRPLQDFFGVGRRIRTERKKETAAGRYSAPAEQNDPAQKSSTPVKSTDSKSCCFSMLSVSRETTPTIVHPVFGISV